MFLDIAFCYAYIAFSFFFFDMITCLLRKLFFVNIASSICDYSLGAVSQFHEFYFGYFENAVCVISKD